MLNRVVPSLARALWRPAVIAALLALLMGSARAEADYEYTVVTGDNPWSITDRLLVDLSHWRRLVAYNKIIDDRKIAPGTVLKIPMAWLKLTTTSVRVDQIAGRVEVKDSQPWRSAREGLQLEANACLRTAQDSTAMLLLKGGSTAVLLEQSEVCVESTGQIVANGATLIRLALMRGRIESQARGLRAPGSRFDITTPAATTSVRGTVFRVSVDGDKARTEVVEGRVAVGNASGDVQLSDATGTLIDKGKAPTPPRPLLPAPDLSGLPTTVDGRPQPLGKPPVAGAERYRTQVLQQVPGATGGAILSDLLAQVVSVPALPEGDYRLRVRGVDAQGLEGLDSEKTIRVAQATAPAPAPTPAPTQVTWREVTVTDQHLVLRWTAVPDAPLYQVQLRRLAASDAADPRDIVFDELTGASTLDLPVPGPGTYAVRIRRASELGKEPAWSEERPVTGRARPWRWRGFDAPWVGQ